MARELAVNLLWMVLSFLAVPCTFLVAGPLVGFFLGLLGSLRLVHLLGNNARGTPHIVSAQGHHFADVPDNFISLINLASVRDIERVAGRPVDPLRFRGNIYVDGWQAWSELDMVGATLTMNGCVALYLPVLLPCAPFCY